MSNRKPVAFMSYVHEDDKIENGYLTKFREHLSAQVKLHIGEEFPIFQDRDDILWGQNWEERIDRSIDEVTFLIPVITPSFFKSEYCRKELERFIKRETELKRNDLILPVYYVKCPQLEDKTRCAADKLARAISTHQWTDWRELRFKPFKSPPVRKALAKLAEQICDALERMHEPASLEPALEAESYEEPGKEEEKERIEKKRDEQVTGEKIFTSRSIGMKFALIPAGEFMMGSNEYDSEKPVHKVEISKQFYLGIYPVTQREWKEVMGNNPSYFKGDDLPVEQVSWNDVQEFIQKFNQKENTNKYRLPSEAEWEYAARAGTKTRYSFGDDESKLGDYAWYDGNSGSKTHEVGQKEPNPWGLYDMHGNVWEWVQDIYHNSYDGAPTDGSAWEVDGFDRVFRGGCWVSVAKSCRSAARHGHDPGRRFSLLGFRLLRIL